MGVTSSADDRANAARDLAQAITSDWRSHSFPLPGPRESGTRVVIRQSVLNEIHRHGQSRTDVEVCGVLVGNGYQDAAGAFVYVEASIRGEHAGNQLAQVTFTSETWCHIQDIMDREHVGQRIVGWYHTHPGFGIFLSPMDLFIHENFFGGAEQLALVYDPLGGDEGVFVWRDGQPAREPVLVEADEPNDRGIESPVARRLPALTAAGMTDPNLGFRIERIERRLRGLLIGLVIVALIAVAWPVVLEWTSLRMADSDRPAAQPAITPSRWEPSLRRPSRESHSEIFSPDVERVRPQRNHVPPTDAVPINEATEEKSPKASDAPAANEKKPSTDSDTQG
jgi:proteasome lid subunit RPN8/RPN11